jgi:putative zinc finger/helix-turn-helix YgiT family protein
MTTKACPMGHGPMELKQREKTTMFRDVELTADVTEHVCPVCGMTASDVKAAGQVQRQIADAYRAKMNLLTGDKIRSLRQAKNLTQDTLAEEMGVGVASIKRWELGNIQSSSMDNLLRSYLEKKSVCSINTYTGNRALSLPRIKRVAKHFEKILGKHLLKKGDKFLFLAKYLWYADMASFRELGKSMTGSTYAALPYGPQLNNYKDLVGEIKQSDEFASEPLSDGEIRIIDSIAEKFPIENQIYDAAHREEIWKEAPTGSLLSYSLAYRLTEIPSRI